MRFAVIGLNILLTLTLVPVLSAADSPSIHIASPHLDLVCDRATGKITLTTRDGKILLRNATCAAMNGAELALGSASDATHDLPTTRAVETLLRGDEIQVTSQTKDLSLNHHITLLRDRPGAVFELIVTNTSRQDRVVPWAEPLRALLDDDAGCHFGVDRDVSRITKALTNGYIYYDPGTLLDFSPERTTELDSRWNAAFYAPQPRQGLVLGYLDNDRSEGRIRAGRLQRSPRDRPNRGAFNLAARSDLHPSFTLRPGESISSGRLILLISDDPHADLEFFAATTGKLHNVRLNPVINGWCTWFVYYGGATEQDILDHARFVARELKPVGMDWIQIDDGYQTAFGDWNGNSRFPHGMKWLADHIRAQGLKPGLWIAPFAISEKTDIAQNHPDWLVKTAKGELQKIVPEHQAQAQYILDVTHPAAQKWLEDLIRTITNDWGYDFIKTDFVEWTILAAEHFHDPSVTKAQAYRLGNQIIRRAMGPERHLLDCGPGPEIVGLLDSMRIGLDRPDDTPGFRPFDQYAGFYNSAIGAASKRYYFHNRTWINDPDHIRLAKLSIPQAQSAATVIAMSGGTTISGDNLPKLDPDRLAILERILPAFGQAARPIDLFDKPQAELFALPIRTDTESYLIVADFNTHSSPQTRQLDLTRLGLDSRKTYLAYEFWSQRFLGEAVGSLTFQSDPYTVNLFTLREKQSIPQILGTDRHYTQGAIELKAVSWDPSTSTLSGTALGPPGGTWTLSIHIPRDYALESDPSAVSGLSDAKSEATVFRGRVRFDQTGIQHWSIRFRNRA